jgi:hypothetical protein
MRLKSWTSNAARASGDKHPAYREHLAAQGNEVRSSTSEEFAKWIQAEYARNKAFLASTGFAKD